MPTKNNENLELLKAIVEQIEKSNMKLDYLIKKKEQQLKKKGKLFIFFKRHSLEIFSLIVTILIFCITQDISNDNSPLNYSIELKESVPKINHDLISGNTSKDYFVIQPYMSYTLKRNGGGQVKEIYLLKVSGKDNNDIQLTSSIIDNEFTNKPKKDSKKTLLDANYKFYALDNNLIWNKKNKTVYIFDPELQMSLLTSTVSTYFLLLRGSNNTTEVITILQKLGDKDESYLDTTISFNSLDIFDFKSWQEQANQTNLSDFEKVYGKTINDYKKVIEFAKENLL